MNILLSQDQDRICLKPYLFGDLKTINFPLRDIDLAYYEKFMSGSYHSPWEAFRSCIDHSIHRQILISNGDVVGIFGGRLLVSKKGLSVMCPWILVSKEIQMNKFFFIKNAMYYLNNIFLKYSLCGQWIRKDNSIIRGIFKKLGFKGMWKLDNYIFYLKGEL